MDLKFIRGVIMRLREKVNEDSQFSKSRKNSTHMLYYLITGRVLIKLNAPKISVTIVFQKELLIRLFVFNG